VTKDRRRNWVWDCPNLRSTKMGLFPSQGRQWLIRRSWSS